MAFENKEITLREAAGVFRSEADLETAANALQRTGFDRADLSVMTSIADAEQRLGKHVDDISQLEDDPRVPRKAIVSGSSIKELGALMASVFVLGVGLLCAILATAGGGSLADALVAAVVGGALTAVVVAFAGSRWFGVFIDWVRGQLDRGGMVLWVRTTSPDKEATATRVLRECGARNVEVHSLATG